MVAALCGVSDPAAVRAISAIAAAWGVRVEERTEGDGIDADALILGPAVWKRRAPDLLGKKPCLAFAVDGAALKPDPDNGLVISENNVLPQVLRGKTFRVAESTFPAGIDPLPGLESAASIEGRPVWKVGRHPVVTSMAVATPPPLLDPGERVSQVFNGETFLHALPAWLFFRGLVAASPRWEPPPLRACLVIDDPNLHGAGYGHIDYRGLVGFSRNQPFHAAIATVPLDGWWVSAAAARLFRENPAALSLLVHGNNHSRYELAQSLAEEQGISLVAQSLERTAALEKKAGLRVDRVMAPPHGVCSPEMMGLLWRGGYEGMITNRWSLWMHSLPGTLPADSGLRPADMLGGGLPVVSRFRFKSSISSNEIYMAALLGQPIVPYGHHQDFSDDMTAVKETAQVVNSLGPVQWMSMRGILETNFERRITGETCHIRLFSRRVKGAMPEGTNRLQVELAESVAGCGQDLSFEWVAGGKPGRAAGLVGEPVVVAPGCNFEVRLTTPPVRFPGTGWHSGFQPAVRLRRLASEVRDRLRL